MRKTPALLMKELKFFREETKRLYKEDEERSFAPVDERLEHKYDTGYVYERNHEEIRRIHAEELRIRSALAKFNATTRVDGLDMTIAEALVRISQLKEEIKALMPLASKPLIYKGDSYRGDEATYKINYNQEVVRHELGYYQRELAKIQMAVDTINLNALVYY